MLRLALICVDKVCLVLDLGFSLLFLTLLVALCLVSLKCCALSCVSKPFLVEFTESKRYDVAQEELSRLLEPNQ